MGGVYDGRYVYYVPYSDDGTAVSQFPGAGNTQANLGGTPVSENATIQTVSNPNPFNTLPATTSMIKVTLQ